MLRADRESLTDTPTVSYRPGPEPELYPLRLVNPHQGIEWVLDQPRLVAGRHSDADLRLDQPDVSRQHCRFDFADGAWRVSDLGSLNGLYLNGQRVLSAELKGGDRLGIGDANFTVEAERPQTPTRQAEIAVLRSILAELGPAPADRTQLKRRA
jgi:pSer/pThr/pTyr-binding forkhead associated (FHA) protein